jgi:hypothetical protein
VYGPVRTVVWQGSVGDHRPYADPVNVNASFPRTPAACGDSVGAFTGGCALRAYPRLISLHRSAVPNQSFYSKAYTQIEPPAGTGGY